MSNVLNYVTANRFYVEMESTLYASFTECKGLGVDIETETYKEGGLNDQQRVFLKQAKFSPVTLSRGVTEDLTFWNWMENILRSKNTTKQRRNINILVFNQEGETMQCWTLIGAVPTSWKAPALKADSTSVAIEELTLTYEGLTITSKTGGGGAIIVKRDTYGYFI